MSCNAAFEVKSPILLWIVIIFLMEALGGVCMKPPWFC
jgi:hypothetical protein